MLVVVVVYWCLVSDVWCGHTASGDITVNQSPVMSPLTATHPHFHYLHVNWTRVTMSYTRVLCYYNYKVVHVYCRQPATGCVTTIATGYLIR